jgi:predicted HTH domain antitoxin
MAKGATLLDAVTVLIERGIYKDRDALMHGAVRALLRSKPELRGQLAVALYQPGDISLTRAAEIGGLDIESCKELLREAGVARRISPIGQEVQHEVLQLLRTMEAE